MSQPAAPPLNEEPQVRARLEDEIVELLEGDLRGTSLAFVAYLNANQMTPRQWFGPGYWRIPYGEYYLCSILVSPGRWRVFFFWGDYSGQFEGRFTKAVQDSVTPCISCTGDDCPKGREMTVFGKALANACFQFPVQFVNPDASALKHIKELLEYWKGVAPYSDSWHCH